MSEIKKGLLYTKDHEWIRVEGSRAYIGISDYAQEELGEVVYVELPEPEDVFDKGDEISSIESVKAASPIINPLGGTVVEINETLEDEPEAVNTDPYGAWIYCIEIGDSDEVEGLLDESAYREYIESL
jgi:glycine cleavage system H protein